MISDWTSRTESIMPSSAPAYSEYSAMISDFLAPERASVSFARIRFAVSVSSGLSGAGSPILARAAVASSICLRRLLPPGARPDTPRARAAGR